MVADRDDLQDRVLLAMALLAAVIVPAALLEDGDLVGLGLRDDLRRDGQPVGRLEAAAVAGEQDVAQRHAVARIAVDLLDDDLVSRGNAILLAARAHDCEHWLFSSLKLVRARNSRGRRARKRAAYGSGRMVSTARGRLKLLASEAASRRDLSNVTVTQLSHKRQ